MFTLPTLGSTGCSQLPPSLATANSSLLSGHMHEPQTPGDIRWFSGAILTYVEVDEKAQHVDTSLKKKIHCWPLPGP